MTPEEYKKNLEDLNEKRSNLLFNGVQQHLLDRLQKGHLEASWRIYTDIQSKEEKFPEWVLKAEEKICKTYANLGWNVFCSHQWDNWSSTPAGELFSPIGGYSIIVKIRLEEAPQPISASTVIVIDKGCRFHPEGCPPVEKKIKIPLTQKLAYHLRKTGL